MDNIKKSLEENLDFIREQLPENLKSDAENCLKEAEAAPAPLTDEEAQKAVLEALPEHCKAEFEKDPVIPKPEPVPTLAEQKAAVLENLPEQFKADFEANGESQLSAE